MPSRRSRHRRPLDLYETPRFATDALVKALHPTGVAFEPCAGPGAIVRVLEDAGMRVYTNDIDRQHDCDGYLDAGQDAPYSIIDSEVHPDWIITNPPFSDAYRILKRAMEWAPATGGVAFFLRISFLEPTQEHVGWLRANRPDYVLNLPRFSWDGDGNTDFNHCAWMVWYGDAAPASLPRGIDFADPIAKEQRRMDLGQGERNPKESSQKPSLPKLL